jgi:hypothetical protein
MLDLVLWSSSVALAPLTLELTWRLISGVAGLIGRTAPGAVVATDPGGAGDRDARRTAAVAAKEGVPCSRMG